MTICPLRESNKYPGIHSDINPSKRTTDGSWDFSEATREVFSQGREAWGQGVGGALLDTHHQLEMPAGIYPMAHQHGTGVKGSKRATMPAHLAVTETMSCTTEFICKVTKTGDPKYMVWGCLCDKEAG